MDKNSNIDDILQIVLVTYNRAQYVENTLKQFFADDSPLKDCEFIIQDNKSTDNTCEVVKKWQSRFPNIVYKKNPRNFGGNANIAMAFFYASKKYVWVIGDDDLYDFSNWSEVESAMSAGEKAIIVARYGIPDGKENDIGLQLAQLTFVSGVIYRTSILTDTVMHNVFDNIYTMFPHVAPAVQLLNDGEKLYVVKKAISMNGQQQKTDCSYTRGSVKEDRYPRSRYMNWMVGYCNILSQIRNQELKWHCIDITLDNNIFKSQEDFVFYMNEFHTMKMFMNWLDIYQNVNPSLQKQMERDLIQTTTSGIPSFVGQNILAKMLRYIFSVRKTPTRLHIIILGIKIHLRLRYGQIFKMCL